MLEIAPGELVENLLQRHRSRSALAPTLMGDDDVRPFYRCSAGHQWRGPGRCQFRDEAKEQSSPRGEACCQRWGGNIVREFASRSQQS